MVPGVLVDAYSQTGVFTFYDHLLLCFSIVRWSYVNALLFFLSFLLRLWFAGHPCIHLLGQFLLFLYGQSAFSGSEMNVNLH